MHYAHRVPAVRSGADESSRSCKSNREISPNPLILSLPQRNFSKPPGQNRGTVSVTVTIEARSGLPRIFSYLPAFHLPPSLRFSLPLSLPLLRPSMRFRNPLPASQPASPLSLSLASARDHKLLPVLSLFPALCGFRTKLPIDAIAGGFHTKLLLDASPSLRLPVQLLLPSPDPVSHPLQQASGRSFPRCHLSIVSSLPLCVAFAQSFRSTPSPVASTQSFCSTPLPLSVSLSSSFFLLLIRRLTLCSKLPGEAFPAAASSPLCVAFVQSFRSTPSSVASTRSFCSMPLPLSVSSSSSFFPLPVRRLTLCCKLPGEAFPATASL